MLGLVRRLLQPLMQAGVAESLGGAQRERTPHIVSVPRRRWGQRAGLLLADAVLPLGACCARHDVDRAARQLEWQPWGSSTQLIASIAELLDANALKNLGPGLAFLEEAMAQQQKPARCQQR